MKISVITVCYNSALTLGRALRSVSDQDWPHVEHIVIDGGSTDGSEKIIERFRSRLAHVVIESDKGIYDAMNKGLVRASGDIVCFLNADDHYSGNSVLSRVAMLMCKHQLDALTADVGFFHEANPERIVRRYRSNRFTPDRLGWGWMPAHPALFLSAPVVRRVGYFKTDYRIAGDYEFIVRVFHGHRVRYHYLPEILVNMQTGGVSNSGFVSKLRLNHEVLRACRENGVQTNIFKILSRYPAKVLELFFR